MNKEELTEEELDKLRETILIAHPNVDALLSWSTQGLSLEYLSKSSEKLESSETKDPYIEQKLVADMSL